MNIIKTYILCTINYHYSQTKLTEININRKRQSEREREEGKENEEIRWIIRKKETCRISLRDRVKDEMKEWCFKVVNKMAKGKNGMR